MRNLPLLRIFTARPHMGIGIIAGFAAYLVTGFVHHQAIRSVAAWDFGSLIFLLLTFISFLTKKNHDISADAKAHQDGEWTVFALTIIGAMMSFAAIILFSGTANHKNHQGLYVGFVVTTLALSWLTTNVVFAYRYAHEYYSTDNGGPGVDGGVQFPHDDQPDYLDFIYFSFVLGMTFQVSDCNITAKKLRRLATMQGLIGFLFNTVILALSVNIAASLL